MRKLLHLIWCVLKSGRPFDPSIGLPLWRGRQYLACPALSVSGVARMSFDAAS
jgi:hypothetical protein